MILWSALRHVAIFLADIPITYSKAAIPHCIFQPAKKQAHSLGNAPVFIYVSALNYMIFLQHFFGIVKHVIYRY